MAGRNLGIAGAGAVAGAGGLALAQLLADQAIPAHSREMTQDEHARNNIGNYRQQYPGLSAQDLALHEGLRQGLMSGAITGSELNTLAAEGRLPAPVLTLLTDVHDFSRDEPYPFGDKTIPEVAAAGLGALKQG